MVKKLTVTQVNRKIGILSDRLDKSIKDCLMARQERECNHTAFSVEIGNDGYMRNAVCCDCHKRMSVPNGFDRTFSAKRIWRYLQKRRK